MKIGVVAPSRNISRQEAETVQRIFQSMEYGQDAELVFHEQCFLSEGHFAGSDQDRIQAFLEYANDPQLDAIWFAAGGYGAGRLLPNAIENLQQPAFDKVYLGYSDTGHMLSALTLAGCRWVAHGPMVSDVRKLDGDIAIKRSLEFLNRFSSDCIEPEVLKGGSNQAFNLSILRGLIGTQYQPCLDGQVLLIEDVSEYLYSTDRSMWQVAMSGILDNAVGVRLGRMTQIPENDIPFKMDVNDIVKHWCDVAKVDFLGVADIGHCIENKIVPFGRCSDWPRINK